jgi:hypothetical protein
LKRAAAILVLAIMIGLPTIGLGFQLAELAAKHRK